MQVIRKSRHRITLRTILRRRPGSVMIPDGGRLTKTKLLRLSQDGWFTPEVQAGLLVFVRTSKPWHDRDKAAFNREEHLNAHGSRFG